MIIQYCDVRRATVSELNVLGRDGWKPSTLVFEESTYDSGWTGLLWREVKSEDLHAL